MKIDLLSNENPLQPSSERKSEAEERESEVMKEQTAQRITLWKVGVSGGQREKQRGRDPELKTE